MIKKKDPIKGAVLKATPTEKFSSKKIKEDTKKAVGSVNSYRKKIDDQETKALKRRKTAAAATLGAMVTGGLAMFRENKRRNK